MRPGPTTPFHGALPPPGCICPARPPKPFTHTKKAAPLGQPCTLPSYHAQNRKNKEIPTRLIFLASFLPPRQIICICSALHPYLNGRMSAPHAVGAIINRPRCHSSSPFRHTHRARSHIPPLIRTRTSTLPIHRRGDYQCESGVKK